MEDKQRRCIRARLRWTLGSIMVLVAVFALAFTLARPFVAQAPPSGEVIGINFTLQQTQAPDGHEVMGWAPKVTMTKQATSKAPAAKP